MESAETAATSDAPRAALGAHYAIGREHAPATGPVVLAYVTSCRELARDERVGRHIVDPMTGAPLGRREGLLESLARRLAEPASELGALFRLGAIVCDDEHDECAAAWGAAPLWPETLDVPAVRVPPVAATGVTVHVVTREVDAGAPVACADWSFDPAAATPESIRHRNYEIKREIVPRALLAYAGSSEGAAAIERGRAASGRRAASRD